MEKNMQYKQVKDIEGLECSSDGRFRHKVSAVIVTKKYITLNNTQQLIKQT